MTVDAEDESIIRQIRNRDEQVLRRIYQSNYTPVQKFVLANSGTLDEARDVYQEAFIAFFQRVQEENFRLTCKVGTYLFAVSKRLWLKRLLMKKRFVININDVDDFLEVEEEMSQIDDLDQRMKIMTNAIEMLGQPCGSIIRDFYLENLSMEQIREKFGYTNAENAKNQKYKCLQRLKRIFFDGYKVVK